MTLSIHAINMVAVIILTKQAYIVRHVLAMASCRMSRLNGCFAS